MKCTPKVNAEFEFKFKRKKDAEVAFKIIEPELKTAPSERSKVRANLDGNLLYLFIDADDAHSLRASINSYLRWIELSNEVVKITYS